MRLLKITFVIFSLVLVFSCNYYDYPEDCESYDYSDCNATEPVKGTLKINLTINDANLRIPVTIYSGKLEDGVVYSRDTIGMAYFEAWVPVNHYYAVTAEYLLNGKKILSLDGSEIRKKSRAVCDSVCWEITGGEINVRLKY